MVYGNKVCLREESLEEFYERMDELLNIRQFEKSVRGLKETEEELYKVQRRAEVDRNHYTHELMELEKKIYVLQEAVDKYYQEKEDNYRKYVELQKEHKALEKKEEKKEDRNILCYNRLSPLGKLKYKVREFIKKTKKIIKKAEEFICAIVDFFTYPLRYVYT